MSEAENDTAKRTMTITTDWPSGRQTEVIKTLYGIAQVEDERAEQRRTCPRGATQTIKVS